METIFLLELRSNRRLVDEHFELLRISTRGQGVGLGLFRVIAKSRQAQEGIRILRILMPVSDELRSSDLGGKIVVISLRPLGLNRN